MSIAGVAKRVAMVSAPLALIVFPFVARKLQLGGDTTSPHGQQRRVDSASVEHQRALAGHPCRWRLPVSAARPVGVVDAAAARNRESHQPGGVRRWE